MMSELNKFKPALPRKVYTLEGEDITDKYLLLRKIKLNIIVLLDEMCTHLEDILTAMGWNVVTVKEVLDVMPDNKSVHDDQILNYAIRENALVVTRDRELKNRCYEMKIPCLSLSSIMLEARIVNQHL
jgi:predicted nuclease of predicted toxin-antitoxin system